MLTFPERAIPLALVLTVVAVFGVGLRNDFVHWDDYNNLVDNSYFRGLGWAQITRIHDSLMGHYIPLTWRTVAILAQPEQPAYFDGVLGVGLLEGTLFLASAASAGSLPGGVFIAAAFSAVFFVGWLVARQQVRYLLPACPGWAVAGCRFLDAAGGA